MSTIRKFCETCKYEDTDKCKYECNTENKVILLYDVKGIRIGCEYEKEKKLMDNTSKKKMHMIHYLDYVKQNIIW